MLTEIPPGWVLEIEEPRWWKPFGYYWRDKKKITVWPVKWLPRGRWRDWGVEITVRHEAFHAWGIRRCNRPWCLMFEGPRWVEYMAIPLQLLRKFKLCRRCSDGGYV